MFIPKTAPVTVTSAPIIACRAVLVWITRLMSLAWIVCDASTTRYVVSMASLWRPLDDQVCFEDPSLVVRADGVVVARCRLIDHVFEVIVGPARQLHADQYDGLNHFESAFECLQHLALQRRLNSNPAQSPTLVPILTRRVSITARFSAISCSKLLPLHGD